MQRVRDIIDGKKLPIGCKVAIQEKDKKPAKQDLELHSSVIKVLSKVTPSEMKDAQQADPTIGQIELYVLTLPSVR